MPFSKRLFFAGRYQTCEALGQAERHRKVLSFGIALGLQRLPPPSAFIPRLLEHLLDSRRRYINA